MRDEQQWVDLTFCREMTDEEVEEAQRWHLDFTDDEGYWASLLAGEEV